MLNFCHKLKHFKDNERCCPAIQVDSLAIRKNVEFRSVRDFLGIYECYNGNMNGNDIDRERRYQLIDGEDMIYKKIGEERYIRKGFNEWKVKK